MAILPPRITHWLRAAPLLAAAAASGCERAAPAPATAVEAPVCGPGGACCADVAPGLRAAAAAIGWAALAAAPPGPASEVRIWMTERPAEAGRVVRVVGEAASAVGEVVSWWPTGERDTIEVTDGTGSPPRLEAACPAAVRRGGLTVCRGSRRGAPYAANLRRLLDSLGVASLPGDSTPGDTLRVHQWLVTPSAFIIETRDAAGRYRTVGYNSRAQSRAAAPAEVERMGLLLRQWE